MGLFGSFSTGVSGLNTSEFLHTTAHNLEIETRGYVRQQVVHKDSFITQLVLTQILISSRQGVDISTVRQVRDVLDKSYRLEKEGNNFTRFSTMQCLKSKYIRN